MTDLRIIDAPSLPTEEITDELKLPTGGKGNYAVEVGGISEHIVATKDLADKEFVNNSSNGVRQLIEDHLEDLENPHSVTKEQVGLGNVDNTADLDKPVSNATQAAITTATQGKADKTYVDNSLNSLQQLTDEKILWIHENGAGLPYDSTIPYVDGSVVLKDGELKQKSGADWLPVAKKEIDASNVVDSSGKNQQQINDASATKFSRLRDSYDLMTDAQIQSVQDGVSSFDAASVITNLITGSNENTVTIKHGTYFIGPTGIQLTGVKDKKIIFEKGVVFKWHPLVVFSTNVRMFSPTDCENITFDEMVLRGANNPAVWVKTEKVIRAGLIDKQTGVMLVNCKRITFNAPDVQNFQWGIYTSSSGVNKSSNIEIKGGYLSGNYCGITWESYLVDGITDCKIENTTSKGNWKWGMWMEAGTIKDSRYIRGIKVTGGSFSEQVEEHGVYVQGQEHSFIGVDFISNNAAGLRMLACGRLHVSECKFNDNGWNRNDIGYNSFAAFIGDDTSTTDVNKRSNNVVITNNIFTSNRGTFSDYKLDNGIIFSDNSCNDNGAPEVDGEVVFRSSQNSKITNNVIRNSKCASAILVRDQGNSIMRNIDVSSNIIDHPSGKGVHLYWGASETNCDTFTIESNTIRNSGSDGIFIEHLSREMLNLYIKNNKILWSAGNAINIFVGATALLNILNIVGNSIIRTTGNGINFTGVSGGQVVWYLESQNFFNANTGRPRYVTPGTVSISLTAANDTDDTDAMVFKVTGVTPTNSEVKMLFEGVMPFWNPAFAGRVKAIEFYSSKVLTGGSAKAVLRNYKPDGTTGTDVLPSNFGAVIPVNQQVKTVVNAMNTTNDKFYSNKYYVGVDLQDAVFAGGGTVDFVVVLRLGYMRDYRFETLM